MLSETLAAGLEQYRIGAKVRALRQKKELGLVQLGEHTGLSPAMLSKIERGQLFPTLPTLMRIALVFGVGLEHFFVEEAERPMVSLVRAKDRLRLPNRRDTEAPSFFFESLDYPVTDRKMEGYYAEFPANAKPSKPHRHKGQELVYVLKGRLAVDVDGENMVLDKGDALFFDSSAQHSYHGQGRSGCAAVVVVSA
jgi:transcriptional regulator with XRE-family HTH domain